MPRRPDTSVTVYRVERDPETHGQGNEPKDLNGGKLLPDHKPLSEQEERFVRYYTEGATYGNAKASALKAGYAKSYASAHAAKLPKRPHIRDAINVRVSAGINKHHEDPVADAMLKRLERIGLFDVGSLYEMDDNAPGGVRLRDLTQIDTTAIKAIKIRTSRDGTTTEVETYDAPQNIERYFKLRGLNENDDDRRVRSGGLQVNIYPSESKPSDPKVVNP